MILTSFFHCKNVYRQISDILLDTGYKTNFSDSAFTAQTSERLTSFPTENEIRKALSVARDRADQLVRFCGMQKVNESNKNSSGSGACSLPSFELDEGGIIPSNVSVTLNKQVKIVYSNDCDGLEIRDLMVEAAAMSEASDQLEANLDGIQDQIADCEAQNLASSRISIQNLLNPIPDPNQPANVLPSSTHSTLASNHNIGTDSSVKLVEPNGDLDSSFVVRLRELHDSEVEKSKGNERKKRHIERILPASNDTQDGLLKQLDSKSASKILSVLIRNTEAFQMNDDRLRQWGIYANPNINALTKEGTVPLAVSASLLLNKGLVSKENPLAPGKFVIIIKKNVCASLKHLSTILITFFCIGRLCIWEKS